MREITLDKKQKWNDAYLSAEFFDAPVATVLSENSHLLPIHKDQPLKALDLACGRAGNAQFLAKRDFIVDAIDISDTVIKGLQVFTEEHSLNINCEVCDVENNGIPKKKYDVIIVSYFLHRPLFSQIEASLKPNGLLFYQTWSQLRVDDSGPNNPAFRLASGELLRLCEGLTSIYYREDGIEGDTTKGLRNEALLIAKKMAY